MERFHREKQDPTKKSTANSRRPEGFCCPSDFNEKQNFRTDTKNSQGIIIKIIIELIDYLVSCFPILRPIEYKVIIK